MSRELPVGPKVHFLCFGVPLFSCNVSILSLFRVVWDVRILEGLAAYHGMYSRCPVAVGPFLALAPGSNLT
jgi:hypothetical protein